MDKLTPKQRLFADNYIISLNATQAYKDAGYKAKNDNVAAVESKRLLQQQKIKDYIQERMESKDAELIASQDEVLNFLTDTMRAANGKHHIAQRLRAAEMLGKTHALFTDRVESNNTNTNFEITIMDDEPDET
jgi:phage terminase small subunit